MKTKTSILFIILLWAAWLRFDQWTAIEHNVDRAYPVWQALDTLENGHFPITGQRTSVLFANPALTGYLFLPVVALTRTALGAYLLVIALNTLAVYWAYRAARAVADERVALLAAGFIAVNPWVVEYSRLTWVQGLLPFFACALAALWWPMLAGKHISGRRVLVGWLCLTLYTQTYLLAFLSAIPLALLVILQAVQMRRREVIDPRSTPLYKGRYAVDPHPASPASEGGVGAESALIHSPQTGQVREGFPITTLLRGVGVRFFSWPLGVYFLFGLLFFTLATALYAAGLFAQSDAVQARLSEFNAAPRQWSATALNHALRLVTGADYPISRGTLAPIADSALRQNLTQSAHLVLVLALVVGILRSLKTSLEAKASGYREDRPLNGVLGQTPLEPASVGDLQTSRAALALGGGLILLIWWGVPIALMSYSGQPVHPFYQLLGLPAGAILAAKGVWVVVDGVAHAIRSRLGVEFMPPTIFGRAGYSGGWVVIVAFVLFGALMSINARRYSDDTLVTPAIDGFSALPLGVGLQVGAKINTDLPEGGTLFADVDNWTMSSLAGRTFAAFSRDIGKQALQIIPAAGGLIVSAAPTAPDIPFAPLADSLALVDGNSIWFNRYPPAFAPQPHNSLKQTSEQGLTLLGYDWDNHAGQIRVTLYWRVESLTSDGVVNFFAPFLHLYNAAGERIAIVDGDGLSTSAWRVGDVHIQRLTFAAPAAPFSVEVGQYDSQAGRNLIFTPQYAATIRISSGS